MQVSSNQRSGIYPLSFVGNVFAAFSGRQYPRTRFGEFLIDAGLNPDSLVRPKQNHGSEIIVLGHSRTLSEQNSNSARKVLAHKARSVLLGGNPQASGSPTKAFGDDSCGEADAIMTNLPGATLGIITADCVPAFFWDPVKKAAGVAHAGWRGLKAGILVKTVSRMREAFDSDLENIQIAFGPFIRTCCYEVGCEFAEVFPEFYKPVSDQKGKMDLAAAARAEIIKAGLPLSSIHDTGICTSCRHESFFSARRGDADERILSIIQIR